jgi:anti-sigma regulatory factor (Ser/Thr protein kinase)
MFNYVWSAAEAAKAAVEFAQKYAAQVEADQQAFVRSKAAVSEALGL